MPKTKHGMARTKLYRKWVLIRSRCNNPNDQAYKDYGGRGIKVCHRWNQFENFRDDMYESYKKHISLNSSTTIERINNDLGYSKENCRWATMTEQAQNKRGVVYLTYKGETLNISQWAKKLNTYHSLLCSRLRMGWSVERTLTQPVKK